MNKSRLTLPCFLAIAFFAGCTSLPKNVAQSEYNAARDYVSMNIAGMTYLELSTRLNQQSEPQYFTKGGTFNLPYYKEEPGSNFSKYSAYMLEINNKMNRLTNRYKRTVQADDFYSWTISNYNE